jgi:hypothetical protein
VDAVHGGGGIFDGINGILDRINKIYTIGEGRQDEVEMSHVFVRFSILILMIAIGMNLAKAGNAIPAEHQVILQGDWIPTKEQTQAALSAAVVAVEKAAAGPAGTTIVEKYEVEAATKISQNMENYAVQFIGQMVDSKKVIFCDFFPSASLKDTSYWRESLVRVEDGGYNYWQIVYDPETGKCGEPQINGPG